MPGRIQHLPFSFVANPGQILQIVESVPYRGHLIAAIIHWPAGCNNLVDVRVLSGPIQVLPREGYLALNDATPTYQLNEVVRANEDMVVEIRNRDAVNPHNIVTTLVLEEMGREG